MQNLPQSLIQKLKIRKQNNSYRTLSSANNLIDFSSNDYLGFAKSITIFNTSHQLLINTKTKFNGATGSRLLSGNHHLYDQTENYVANFHQVESAIIFNSGYDANVGFFGSVPQRSDIILYDQLCHASIRDGILMSNAKSFKFAHNDCKDLEILIQRQTFINKQQIIYVVTESVFSMDGDSPNLLELTSVCEKNNCLLVIDEAHALGVFGQNGEGLVQELQLQHKVFARIVTFGKSLGCHGAAILGKQDLKDYLVNFARSFIYTTGLSPHSVATILTAYQFLENHEIDIKNLQKKILFFNQKIHVLGLKLFFIESISAIQCAIISGNEKIKTISNELKIKGFDVKAILYPTVQEDKQRLRICLHSFNTTDEISEILELINLLLKT